MSNLTFHLLVGALHNFEVVVGGGKVDSRLRGNDDAKGPVAQDDLGFEIG